MEDKDHICYETQLVLYDKYKEHEEIEVNTYIHMPILKPTQWGIYLPIYIQIEDNPTGTKPEKLTPPAVMVDKEEEDLADNTSQAELLYIIANYFPPWVSYCND